MSPTTEIVTGAVAAGVLALGGWQVARSGMAPTSQLFGRTLIDAPDPDAATLHTVALTYDDGPSPRNTPALLDVLAAHNVRATFFLVGDHVRKYPAIARRIAAEGHLIGNHTQTHPNLAKLTPARVRDELRDCQHTIQDVTGVTPVFFRPPFGARRPDILRAARSLRLTTVLWNVTAEDWEPIGSERMLTIVDEALRWNCARRRTSNILLHDASHLDTGTELLSREDSIRVTAALLARPGLRFTTADRRKRSRSETRSSAQTDVSS